MKFSVADSEKQSAALRSVDKHFQEASAEPQIRSATLGMTKRGWWSRRKWLLAETFFHLLGSAYDHLAQ
jgi:hypothetical protein